MIIVGVCSQKFEALTFFASGAKFLRFLFLMLFGFGSSLFGGEALQSILRTSEEF